MDYNIKATTWGGGRGQRCKWPNPRWDQIFGGGGAPKFIFAPTANFSRYASVGEYREEKRKNLLLMDFL